MKQFAPIFIAAAAILSACNSNKSNQETGGMVDVESALENLTTVTPSGKFVGVLMPEAIDEWMDAHPDATLPASLAGYTIDANPILVLID